MSAAEQAARRTAAVAALGDYRREEAADAIGAGPAMPWAMWAGRLAAALGSVLELTEAAMPEPAECRGCGYVGCSGCDGQEPYCTTCQEWVGMFYGLDGWQHFRGDGYPGGARTLFEADHPAVIGWTVPPGRGLSPAGLETLRQALDDAVSHRDPAGSCTACESRGCEQCAAAASAYAALARQLGIEVGK